MPWPTWENNTCGECGYRDDKEPSYLLECPSCGKLGCDECMPAGRGCACPECEESDEVA